MRLQMTIKKPAVIAWSLAALLAFTPAVLARKGSDDSKSSSGSGDSGSGGDDGRTRGSDDPIGHDVGDDKGLDPARPNAGDDKGSEDKKGTPANFDKTQIKVAATSAGTAIHAEGHVDIRVAGAQQRLSVEVETDAVDGTVYNIRANGIPVGIATLRLGEGEFEFETEDGGTLPGGLLPGDINLIVVTDAGGTVLLQAQFGALGNGSPAPVSAASSAVTKKVNLAATAAAPAGGKGEMELRVRGVEERFKVEVEANVPDGTAWSVFVNGLPAPLGTLTLKLQRAELQLETGATLPAGLASLSQITTVSVTAADGVTVPFNGTF